MDHSRAQASRLLTRMSCGRPFGSVGSASCAFIGCRWRVWTELRGGDCRRVAAFMWVLLTQVLAVVGRRRSSDSASCFASSSTHACRISCMWARARACFPQRRHHHLRHIVWSLWSFTVARARATFKFVPESMQLNRHVSGWALYIETHPDLVQATPDLVDMVQTCSTPTFFCFCRNGPTSVKHKLNSAESNPKSVKSPQSRPILTEHAPKSVRTTYLEIGRLFLRLAESSDHPSFGRNPPKHLSKPMQTWLKQAPMWSKPCKACVSRFTI